MLSQFLPIFLDIAVKTALILLLAIACRPLLAHFSAAARHLLWAAAMAALIALPFLSLLLPQWRLSLLPAAHPTTVLSTAPLAPPSRAIVESAPSNPIAEPPTRPPARAAQDALPADAGLAAEPMPPQPPLRPLAPAWFASPAAWIMLLWLSGALLWMSRWIVGRIILARWMRQSHAPDSWCSPIFVDAQRYLHIRRRVCLAVGRQVRTPLTFGLFAPVILLPHESASWSRPRMQAVLLHELAHIARADWLMQLLAHLAVSLHWFNPLAWYAARQLRLESEKACDDRVLGNVPRPSDYAQHLLDIAITITRSSRAAVPMARPGQLETRITSILDASRNRRPATRRAIALAAVAAALLLLPLASLHLARALAETSEALSPQQGVVLNPDMGWHSTGWAGQLDTSQATMRFQDHSVAFRVYQPNKRKVWTHYPAWPIDWTRFPLLTLKYRATGTDTATAHYLLWLDDATGPDNGGVSVFRSKDVIADGQEHELHADLRTLNLKGKGQIIGLALGIKASDHTPATFELLGLKFEAPPHASKAAAPAEDSPITIQVTAAQSDQPLPGATVTIDPDRLNYARSAVTDAQGIATITPLASPDHKHMLRVEKQGMATVDVSDTSRLEHPIQLHMSRLIQYSGQVVNEQKQPIAGAWVNFSFRYDPRESRGVRAILVRNTVTDQTGHWSAMLPADLSLLGLNIIDPNYMSSRLLEPYGVKPTLDQMRSGSAVTILQKGLPVTGTVYDSAGKPVPNAQIVTGADRFMPSIQSTTTDAAGHYRFPNLPPGKLVLTATAASYGPALVTATVKPDMKALDIHLTPPHLFKARAVDEQGNPIPGARFYAVTWRDMRTLTWSAQADKNGQVTWPDAPAGPVLFDILKQGYGDVRGRPMSAADGKEYVVTLRPPLTIHGTITDAVTGKPIAKCTIISGYSRENSPPGWNRSNAKIFENGTYTYQFTYPQAGHLLRVEADNYRPAISPVFKDNQGNVSYNFKLQPGKSITGILRNPDGKPAAGMTIYIYTPSIQGTFEIANGQVHYAYGVPTLTTGPDGTFTLTPQNEEYWLITAGEPGFAQVSQKEFEADHEIKLKQWGRVIGTAYIGDKPAANRQIQLNPIYVIIPGTPRRPFRDYDRHETTSDASGRFVFNHVPPGKVSVGRTIFGYEWSTTAGPLARVDVKPSQTATVTIGGHGRPVIGKAKVPPELESKIFWPQLIGQMIMQVSPPPNPLPPDWKNMTAAEKKQWWEQFRNSTEGKAFIKKSEEQQDTRQFYAFAFNSDGSFRIEDVVPGTYVINSTIYGPPATPGRTQGPPIALLQAAITVPPIPTGRSDKPLDIGTLTLKPIPATQPASPHEPRASATGPRPNGSHLTTRRTDAQSRPHPGVTVTIDPARLNDVRSAASVPHKGIVVTGTVYDTTGQPVANARVAQGVDQNIPSAPPIVHTDAAGHFRLSNTPLGQLTLTVSAPGNGPALLDTIAESDMKPIDIHLTQPHTFRFRVVDKQGSPLSGATIQADMWRDRRTLDWSALTDKDGRAVWNNAPADPIFFAVYKEGYVFRRDPAMRMSPDNGKEHVVALWPPLKIHGTVTDAVTGKPIEQYRLISGEQFRNNQDEISWEFYNAKIIHGEKYEITLAIPYPAHALRVEVNGYRPAVSRLFRSEEGEQSCNFKLQPAQSTTGVLRDADGKPLAGLDIYVSLPGTQIDLSNGRFRANGMPPIRSQADGSFAVPPQAGDYALITGNNDGFANVSKAQFEAKHEIALQPWGRVTGIAMIGSKPAAQGHIFLRTNLDGRFQETENQTPLIFQADDQTTDAAGRFSFDKVMPQTVDVSRLTLLHPRRPVDASVEVKVDSGRAVTVRFGGLGRPVIGKIIAPPELGKVDWSHLATIFRTRTPAPPFPDNWQTLSGAQKKQWIAQWRKTPRAKAYFEQEEKSSTPVHKYPIVPNPDGSFRLEDVEAGTYDLGLELRAPLFDKQGVFSTLLAQYRATITVPPIPTGRSDKPLDIGTLTLTPAPTSNITIPSDILGR